MYTDNDFRLYHHGILGQKWGIRRFQNRDGTYTEAGRKRYLGDNKSTRQAKSTGKDTKEKSFNSFVHNHKKEIIIGSTAVVSILAVYGGYKLYKKYGSLPAFRTYGTSDPLHKTINSYPSGDFTIRKAQRLQRVSSNPIDKFSDVGHAYVSYKFRDNQRYKSGFVKELNVSGARNFVHQIRPQKDMKIASPKTSADIFLGLHPDTKDQTFRLVMSPYSTNDKYSDDPVGKIISKYRREFYDELIKQGYNGLVDIEDASKVRGSSPLIILNPQYNITDNGSHTIGKIESIVAEILK